MTVLKKTKKRLQKIFGYNQAIDQFKLIDANLNSIEPEEFIFNKSNFDSTKIFFLIFSHKNGVFESGLPVNSRLLHEEYNPPAVTLGFKQIFWKVFKRAYSIQLQIECIEWLGMKFFLREAFVFVTREESCMPTEDIDCLTVYCLESIDYLKDEIATKIEQERQARKLTDLNLMEEFNSSIGSGSYSRLSKIKSSKFPGYSLVTEAYPEGSENVFPFFYGFYCYGWLLFLRLERSQINIDLDLDFNQATSSQSLKHIVNHRIRLLNLQRYFFTINRSKIKSSQKAADILTDHFHLRSRYARHIDIHKSFEEHLANVARFSETERSKTFKYIATILTFLGLPLAIFSALMSANSDAAIVVKPENLWSNYKFLIIAIVSFVIPSSLVFVGFFVDAILKLKNLLISKA